MNRLSRFAGTAVAIALALAAVTPVAGQNVKESFTGFAINMNSGPRTAVIDFFIDRWSTDDERNQLLSIIGENQDPTQPLLRSLQKMPSVGRIRTSTSLGWDLRYAHEFKLDEGGRRIVLATDRPIGFMETRNQTRTMDYPFTIIEIRLNANDEGEGKILAGTKIFVDKNKHLVLENYGQQPVRFNEIKKQK
jgi:hypothetical protein